MAAARHHEMLDNIMVLTAAQWAEWLHPRGIDGRFIEVGSMVDIFGKSGEKGALRDPGRDRKRARIVGLYPEGAKVEYFDVDGNPTPSDAKHGYPSVIQLAQIKAKVSSAPNARARIPGISSEEEFKTGGVTGEKYREPLDQDAYEAQIMLFNKIVQQQMNPDRSAAVKGGGTRLTDEEFAQHQAYVTEVTDFALGKSWDEQGIGLASDVAYKDSYGRWSDAELENMLNLATEIYGQITTGKPQNRRAIMLGGLPGVGKSTLLTDLDSAGSMKRDEWVEINPDLVKDEMISRGMYPDVIGLAPAETAGFIHAQSSEIAAMLERMAMKDGYNIVFDTTLGKWADQTISDLHAYNYDNIDGIYIDAALNHSIASINYRHMDGLNKYRTGISRSRNGMPEIETQTGGRFVPTKVAQGLEGNKENFDRLKVGFSRWALFEVTNSVGERPTPELVASTGEGMLMPGNYPAKGVLV